MTIYSLEDLAAAKADFDQIMARWENYSGNNPNKYHSQIESARVRLHLIEEDLKKCSLIARTPREIRDAMLNDAFPNAKSKEIVDWQGQKYMRRFSPLSKSRSGKTVTTWRKYWEEVDLEK